MNKKLLAGLASAIVALPAFAALQQGDKAPAFKAQASLAGKEFSYVLADELKKGPVVVYFYPSAYTQGCNIQAHTFAENMEKFTAAKATVIGVSLDSIARLNDFSADPAYCAGKLAVASDTDGSIAKSYQLMVARRARRCEGYPRKRNRPRLRGTHDVHREIRRHDRRDRRRRVAGRERNASVGRR